MPKQVLAAFQVTEAKLTEVVVGPSSSFESVVAPELVQVQQPKKHFALARCPNLPD